MPKSVNIRNGKRRNRWTCPNHPKEGMKKTVVGKPCPTCGTMGKTVKLDWAIPELPEFEEDNKK